MQRSLPKYRIFYNLAAAKEVQLGAFLFHHMTWRGNFRILFSLSITESETVATHQHILNLLNAPFRSNIQLHAAISLSRKRMCVAQPSIDFRLDTQPFSG